MPFHSVGHVRDVSLYHYPVFTDGEKQCKSAEGFGQLVCDLRGTDKDISQVSRKAGDHRYLY